MQEFDPQLLNNLYKPASGSHKGDNGKLLIIAGSKLFHAASLWPLTVASRIVDMVFYASVPENNELVQKAKEEFRNGIVIPRSKTEDYIQEADCVLIGPGLPRDGGEQEGDDDTRELTEGLLGKFPEKKWVVDGGSLQTIKPDTLPKAAIITPHKGEFEKLKFKIQNSKFKIAIQNSKLEEQVRMFAEEFGVVVLLKGEQDIVSDGNRTITVSGGNPGMTKGGTGDVLAGLVASLYCKNDAFLSACAGSYINKKAGESLEKKIGTYFNASDLASEIPIVMKQLVES
jgi:NAD(P)H-hydrate epimerase